MHHLKLYRTTNYPHRICIRIGLLIHNIRINLLCMHSFDVHQFDHHEHIKHISWFKYTFNLDSGCTFYVFGYEWKVGSTKLEEDTIYILLSIVFYCFCLYFSAFVRPEIWLRNICSKTLPIIIWIWNDLHVKGLKLIFFQIKSATINIFYEVEISPVHLGVQFFSIEF